MACCGGEVNVLSREHDVADKATQTENEEEENDDDDDDENEEGQNVQGDGTSHLEETSV